MKEAIVVGSGAGGATVAKELQGRFAVTVLEEGGEFHPFSLKLGPMEWLKRTRTLFDEREIQLAIPSMRIRKSGDMVLVNGVGLGGTTTLCAGNAVRMDGDLKALGIDLDEEFAALYREIPISTAHQKRWRPATRQLFEICREMGMEPRPMPKMGEYARCANCGRCVFGCPYGVKWDSRQYLRGALERGARVVTGARVEQVVVENGRVTGVQARKGWRRRFYRADLVVLAAGGLGTPIILERSGVACEPGLFVDPVLCVSTEWPDAMQCRELSMPFVVQREHYILSPYFDYLSFFFHKEWKPAARNTLTLMIKLADEGAGYIAPRGLSKTLTPRDREQLRMAVRECRAMLRRLGIEESRTVLGTMQGGHPGGMLPLTAREAATLHHDRLPENLYVADATLLPKSLGNPPILTIIALAKRIARLCAERAA